MTERVLFGGFDPEETQLHKTLRYLKIVLLFLWWFVIFILIVLYGENPPYSSYVAVSAKESRDVVIQKKLTTDRISIKLEGAFALPKYEQGIGVLTFEDNKEILLQVQSLMKDNGAEEKRKELSKKWILKLVDTENIETAELIKKTKTLKLNDFTDEDLSNIVIHLETNMDTLVPLALEVEFVSASRHSRIILGSVLILVFYILIVFGVVPRSFAAILVCSMSIGILGWLYTRPSFPQILQWMNIDFFMMQFGTSLIVTITLKSGVYNWLAVHAFGYCRGHVWPFLYIMIVICIVLSLLFETCMVVIIVSPFVFLMCQLMSINAIPVVIILTCFLQIAQIPLPYSSLLNRLIYNQPYLVENQITTQAYLKQGVLFSSVIFLSTFTYLRLVFYDSSKIGWQETEAEALKRIIDVLDDTAYTIAGYTHDEHAVKQHVEKKVEGLQIRLKRLGKMPKPIDKFEEKLERYRSKMVIKDKFILLASIFPFIFILVIKIVYFFKNTTNLGLGWASILAALWFIIIIGENDLEGLLYKIDWVTFIFMACRYVFTCALSAMWLEDSIGQGTKEIIKMSGVRRAWASPIIIFWIATISACLLDNIAVADTMISVVCALCLEDNLNLKLKPAIYATTFGLHIGALGTQISSMESIVFSGLVKRHVISYPFYSHFKVCFPLMLINGIISTIYIVLVHYVAEFY